jgi:hypothetical protein
MRLRVIVVVFLGAIGLIAAAGASAIYALGQRTDYRWRPSVAIPT